MSKRRSLVSRPEAIVYQGAFYLVVGLFRKDGEQFVTFTGMRGIEQSVPLAQASIFNPHT